MNRLKELVDKVYLDLQKTEWINEYPELSEKKNVADGLEAIALNILEDFVPENDLEKFANSCEALYTEETFKKYITNYPDFLKAVEDQFYQSLAMEVLDE